MFGSSAAGGGSGFGRQARNANSGDGAGGLAGLGGLRGDGAGPSGGSRGQLSAVLGRHRGGAGGAPGGSVSLGDMGSRGSVSAFETFVYEHAAPSFNFSSYIEALNRFAGRALPDAHPARGWTVDVKYMNSEWNGLSTLHHWSDETVLRGGVTCVKMNGHTPSLIRTFAIDFAGKKMIIKQHDLDESPEGQVLLSLRVDIPPAWLAAFKRIPWPPQRSILADELDRDDDEDEEDEDLEPFSALDAAGRTMSGAENEDDEFGVDDVEDDEDETNYVNDDLDEEFDREHIVDGWDEKDEDDARRETEWQANDYGDEDGLVAAPSAGNDVVGASASTVVEHQTAALHVGDDAPEYDYDAEDPCDPYEPPRTGPKARRFRR